MKLRLLRFPLLAVMLLSGCNYDILKDDRRARTPVSLPPEQKAQLSYAYIYQNVFKAKCVSCHGASGGVNLETFGSTKAHLREIQTAVFDTHSMPKQSSLSTEESGILRAWLEIGAPENSSRGTQPPPTEEPLQPTFDSISKNVFNAKCVTCHSSIGQGHRVLLDKASLLNSPLQLVIPGNADDSGLVIDIERNDDKRMPPAADGYSELKPEEKKAIRDWITNGAKD